MAADPAAPADFPGAPEPFVGRRDELARLDGLLRPPGPRLVTLSGPGGVGKSRLAQQACAALGGRFAGRYRADLAASTDAEHALGVVAQAVGAHEPPGAPAVELLRLALAGAPALLLLDNCERLADAPAALAALAEAAPALTVLATSRGPLGAPGEIELAVPPLATPPAGAALSVDDALAYDSTRLLVELARAAHPDFRPAAGDGPALAALCRRLDGLPLAIELAAGQVGLLGPRAALERLEQRHAHPRGAAGEGGALEDTIAWSYDQLAPAARELLRRLSVFAGGAGIRAIEAVCAPAAGRPADLVDALGALAARHLARRISEGAGGVRVVVPETIRSFAQALLAAHGDLRATRRRHAEHFLGLAEGAAARLGGPEQRRLLDELEAEHDNLRAALDWALDPRGDPEIGLRLAAALARFWVIRGHLAEGRALLARLLADTAAPPAFAAAQPRPLREARAAALLAAGQLAHHQRDAAASAAFGEALALCRELGLRAGEAHALRGLGNGALERGQPAEARAHYEASLAIAEALGLGEQIAPLLNNLGLVALSQGELTRAGELLGRCLELCRRQGDADRVSALLSNLGVVAMRAGDLPEAGARLRESLELTAAAGDGWGLAHLLGRAAELAAAAGRPQGAAWLLGAAEAYPGYYGRLDKADRAAHDALLAQLRAALAPRDLAEALAAGGAAPAEEALARARSALDS